MDALFGSKVLGSCEFIGISQTRNTAEMSSHYFTDSYPSNREGF